jgi:hypothetical protein
MPGGTVQVVLQMGFLGFLIPFDDIHNVVEKILLALAVATGLPVGAVLTRPV